jgi:hypothetical protein
MRVNGEQISHGQVPISAPISVLIDYHRKAPFAFDGTIERMHVGYLATENVT